MTKHLTELHGGSLKIETVEAIGTAVTVILPSNRIVDLEAVVSNEVGA